MVFTTNSTFSTSKDDAEINEPLIFHSVHGDVLEQPKSSSSTKKGGKKLVYLVKNATHMSVESVLTAVLGSSNSPSPRIDSPVPPVLMPLSEPPPLVPFKKMTSLLESKKESSNQLSQKVFVEGSDGKEMMVFLDYPFPEKKKIDCSPEDVDDPLWTKQKSFPTSAARRSKLKRARNAVRNSVKTLRLPKPLRKREIKEKSNSVRRPLRVISKDDPNYAIMMEKFSKPVSLSTLKRHGLYQPKPNSYKMTNAPYKKDVAPYIEKVSDTEFRCKICLSASFRWNYKAEIHILEHLDRRPFECDVCGRSFTQNQYLRKHKRLHFPDENKFICEICGKGYQRRYYLTYHMDEHFDSTYTCQECGREFSLRQKHDEHVRYHHKCHYSVCDICGHTLRSSALSRHRKHHMEKGQPRKRKEKEEPRGVPGSWTSCEICGRSFRSVSARDHHHQEHSNARNPFQCEVCGVYFKTKRSLNDHTMLLHSNIVEDESQVATRVLDELTGDVIVTIQEEI